MITSPNETASERHLSAQGRGKIRCRNLQRSLLPEDVSEACLRQLEWSPVSARGTFPALSDIGPGCLGALKNRALGSVNVRSPHRRLIPEKRNPVARFLGGISVLTGLESLHHARR